MGLVAREIEKRGIPTICMSSAYDVTHAVRPPRAVFLNFPLNHQTGKPNDLALQTQILRDTFGAFETLSAPGQILTLPYVWDPNDASWEENDYGPGFELYGVGTSPVRRSSRSARCAGRSARTASRLRCGRYSMTRFARTRTVGGIVNPSAFAVFRLMTSSNLSGCSTGRSAGLAPFAILSTRRAACLPSS